MHATSPPHHTTQSNLATTTNQTPHEKGRATGSRTRKDRRWGGGDEAAEHTQASPSQFTPMANQRVANGRPHPQHAPPTNLSLPTNRPFTHSSPTRITHSLCAQQTASVEWCGCGMVWGGEEATRREEGRECNGNGTAYIVRMSFRPLFHSHIPRLSADPIPPAATTPNPPLRREGGKRSERHADEGKRGGGERAGGGEKKGWRHGKGRRDKAEPPCHRGGERTTVSCVDQTQGNREGDAETLTSMG